jgi:non-specific protein-tyrosine kinase
MRLRKALDKAKKEREKKTGTSSARRRVVGPQSAPSDWKPPVYDQSRRIKLKTDLLVENRCIAIMPEAPEIDSYKVLRTKIQHVARVRGWNTIMVTSTRPQEGKTLTAINLALTFAKTYEQTVLLVDCDFKRQNIHTRLGLKSKIGLIDYLVNDRPLNELIIWPEIEKFTLISGGRPIENSTELMNSPRMKELVTEMKERYADRTIIFDVPPILSGADSLAFAPLVDCLVMVVQAGTTSADDIKKALEAIPDEKFLGFVLNRATASAKDKYGYY